MRSIRLVDITCLPLSSSSRLTVAIAFAAATSLVSAPARADGTYFTDVTDTAFPMQPCGPSASFIGCYTNFALLADINGDGALDVLFANGGGYYAAGTAQPSVVYLNQGKGTFADVTSTLFADASSRLRQVAVADIDGDGLLDVYMPGGYGVDLDKLFAQNPAGTFTDVAAKNLPAALKSRAGAAHFGDLDGDGDMDLVVTDWSATPGSFMNGKPAAGNVHLYLNDGAGHFVEAPKTALPAALDPALANTPIDIDTADVNGDFALDLVVDMRNGQSRLFLNDGAGTFTDATADLPKKQGPYSYNIEACDIDGDGDLDLLIDNAAGDVGANNRTQILVNDGAGHFTDESLARITGEPNTDDNAVKCVDVDGDGDFDLLVASLANDAEKLLINDGTGHFSFVSGAIPAASDPTLGLDVGDLDGDGAVDFVTGQGEENPRLNRVYRASGLSVADTKPPVFRAIEHPKAKAGEPIVMRLGVSDAHTSEVGQEVTTVDVGWVNGASSGKVAARFIGGDLWRAVVPAQADGSLVLLTPSATDRGGRTTTAAASSVAVGMLPGQGGGGAGGEAGGAGAAGTGGTGGAGGDSAGGSGGIGGTPMAGGAAGMGGAGGDAGGQATGAGGGASAGKGGAPASGGSPTGGTGGSMALAGGAGSSGASGSGTEATAAAAPESSGGCSTQTNPAGSPLLAGWLVAGALLVRRRRSRG